MFTTTHLDDYVSNLYLQLGIHTPEGIVMSDMASMLNITLTYFPFPSRFDMVGELIVINIDSRESEEIQHIQFLHELGHVLRHYGNQLDMPSMFRQYQEWDARRFALSAAIPVHMAQYVDWTSHQAAIATAALFRIPVDICIERLFQLVRRAKRPYFVPFQ